MNTTTDTLYRDAVSLSLPREKTIRGYSIRRMPIGQFLTALQTLRELPGEVLDTLLPGLTPKTMLSRIKGLTVEEMKEMAVRLVTVLPGYGISLLARLMGVEEGDLLRDEMIAGTILREEMETAGSRMRIALECRELIGIFRPGLITEGDTNDRENRERGAG